MSAPREARPSTDQESAPLLRDPDNPSESDATQLDNGVPKTFSQRVNAITQEPLTPLGKVLLVTTLVLLLLSSVFIGLFAGAQHKIKAGRGGEGSPTATITETVTPTHSHSHSATATTPVPQPTSAPGHQVVCTTPTCVLISASIITSLDEEQDPCEDFYQFSNGGWIAANEIPPGRGLFGSFDVVSQDNKRVIRQLVEPPIAATNAVGAPSYDDQILKKLRGFYASCMNEELLHERGLEPLLDIVRIVRSAFHGNSSKTTPEWAESLTASVAFLHSRGIGALFDFQIDGDVGVDPNAMSLWFSQPELGLPSKEYYEEDPIREMYTETLATILLALDSNEEAQKRQILSVQGETADAANVWPPWPWPPWGDDDDGGEGGGDKDKNKDRQPLNKTEVARELAKNITIFERKIGNASLDLEDLYLDPIGTYNPTPFTEFAKTLPHFDLGGYLATFAIRSFPTQVILTSTTYADSLSSILSSTPSEVVEAYLVTRVALSLAPKLGMNTPVWQAHRALVERLQGIKRGQVPDRADWCVQQVEESMGFAAGRFFAAKEFGGGSRRKATKVITDIIESFKLSLNDIKWMDNQSAKAAAEKADAIRVKVGYPLSPDTTSAVSIARYYNLVRIDEDTFLENVVSAIVSEVTKKWQRLGKRRNLEEWEMYPSQVNAYFSPPANEIVFPAGILKPPFFSQDWPSYLAYGAFGQVASHELTHAFDSSGRLYNQEGKLKQWWTNATSEGFQSIQNCISKQYSSYAVDDGKGGKVHVNGNLTSGENIGDSGLIQSYRAWKAQYDTSVMNGNEYLLPGLNYTQEQLFFIAFGRVWGQMIKPAAAVQRVRTDPHSPNKYRVEGTLSNIPEFAKAFNCPVGAKLNPPPEKQCILWS